MDSLRVYDMLLRLYPRDYRVSFSAEMRQVFAEAADERRKDGRVMLARFVFAELVGVAIGVAVEWLAKLTSDRSTRGRCLPDWQVMRPLGVTRNQWFGAHNSKSWRN